MMKLIGRKIKSKKILRKKAFKRHLITERESQIGDI